MSDVISRNEYAKASDLFVRLMLRFDTLWDIPILRLEKEYNTPYIFSE